jgi:arsenate reductase
MTCSDAEKSCPSDSRSIRNINMVYQDPKIFDNTWHEKEEYLKTSKLIAEELNYTIKNLVNPI